MYSPVYRRMGYSRSIEEGGTLMSPLTPWNPGGAFVISALCLDMADGNIEVFVHNICFCLLDCSP